MRSQIQKRSRVTLIADIYLLQPDGQTFEHTLERESEKMVLTVVEKLFHFI